MENIKTLKQLLNRVYDGKAWHGPSIIEVLKDINEITAQKKLGASHSIVQMVLHMIAWRTFVTRRLMGDAIFEVTDEQNFPTNINWSSAIQSLKESQAELLKAIDGIDAGILSEPVANRKYDYFVLLHGIIHHDIYHIGQIQLIKKYG